jgi:hypothetical protein
MDYAYTGDFSRSPTGPFTNGNKKSVWTDPSASVNQDFDPNGTYYSIVSDSRFSNSRACRMLYKKGRYGMNDQSYQVRYPSPGQIANLEYSILFEPNFSFYTPNSGKVGNGKLGPCIQWGNVGGSSNRGTRCMFWWNANGSNYGNPVFQPTCQDQATGNQLIQPVVYGPRIQLDRLYKLRIQVIGGPQGRAQYWIDDTLVGDSGTRNILQSLADDVFFDFAFFSGGASADYAPEHDSYTRHGNIRCWSGDRAYPGTGNGNGGGTPPDPTPPPDTGTSPYSIALAETKIFRAHFVDNSIPPQEVPAQGDVKWSLTPNNVSWGAQAGPHWSAIEVTGKTVGGPCTLIATDPATGISTKPTTVDITETPRPPKPATGFCTVEPKPEP